MGGPRSMVPVLYTSIVTAKNSCCLQKQPSLRDFGRSVND